MKSRIIKSVLMLVVVIGFHSKTQAQWVVTDPVNLAQGIVNTTKEIIETSATATNMINNFKETVKIYEQGKKYYDKLKKVNNLVKDARKVRKAILMVGEVSDIYVNNYQKMLYDENYTPQELTAIASGYAKLLEESADLLKELRKIVNPTTLSLNDKERMDMVERFYSQIKEYRDLVQYFTNKNISVSYLRAKKKGSASKVVALYGTASERNW
ncbi:MAG: DUF4141 domain-containing protein [Flavobacteriaceae bacterium]|nr:DUF4141 domain-containing protein [Flavobacteriaceae bacterium]